MTTISVEVPTAIAKKYGKSVINYKDLLHDLEESQRTDIEVEDKPSLSKFYDIVKDTDGAKVD